MASILFVCSGNICRSAMAEGIARARLDDAGIAFASAGTWAGRGNPATPEAVVAAAQIGVDIRAHRSRPLDADMAGAADLVYGMTTSHLAAWPTAVLLDPSGREIADPYGLSAAVYAAVRDQIVAAIDTRAPDWRALTR